MASSTGRPPDQRKMKTKKSRAIFLPALERHSPSNCALSNHKRLRPTDRKQSSAQPVDNPRHQHPLRGPTRPYYCKGSSPQQQKHQRPPLIAAAALRVWVFPILWILVEAFYISNGCVDARRGKVTRHRGKEARRQESVSESRRYGESNAPAGETSRQEECHESIAPRCLRLLLRQ